MSLRKPMRNVSAAFLAAASSGTALACVVVFALLATVTPAQAASITINPTFDPSIAGVAGAEGAINAAIAAVEGAIYSPNNITVSIYFTNLTGGLGESVTGEYLPSYFTYYNAFKAVATNPTQLAALNSLGTAPTGPASGNPVNGNNGVVITSAEGRNLGFATPGFILPNSNIGSVTAGGTFDSEIGLNTSITSPPNGLAGFYGLESVANHEIDEALGIGGPGSTLGGSPTGPVGDLDLFRYSAPGVRSYSTSAGSAYFSIDGGNTVLSFFNQVSGADFADWASDPIPAGFGPQVQDAFGEPGTNPSLGPNEITALEAIGYGVNGQTAVPEPASLTLLGLGLAGAAARRRAKAPRRQPRA